MTDLPEVKLKSLVNFPINAVGRTGITSTKDAGRIYLDLNYADFQITPSVSVGDMPNSYNLIWNEETETFAKVPFSLQATSGVASLGGQTGALTIDGTLRFTGSTLSVGDVGAQIYSTRATVAAASIPAVVTSILVRRYTSSDPISDAPYKRGAGSQSFVDALGSTWSLDLSGPVVKARWFQVKGDGVTDDTAKLRLAVTASTGKTLLIEGICGVSARIVMPDDSTIVGSNNKLDGFIVLGTSPLQSGILYANNKSNITIRNLRFSGNLIEPNPLNDSGAIKFELDNASAGDMVSFEVSKCFFELFRTTDWIWFVSAAQVGNTNTMREIKVFDNEVYAILQCAVTNAISGDNGNTFVRVSGNTLAGAGALGFGLGPGSISNVLFHNNSCYGVGLSGMFMAFANTRDMVVSNNVTRAMGNNTLPADRSYTYTFYNSSTGVYADPTNIVCSNNVGYGNHSQAIYFAGCTNAVASGNSFGFTYPSGIEPTLPHGAAIALNGCLHSSVTGNTLTDGLGGIAYVGITDRASTVTISGNTIRSSTNSSASQNAYGILLTGDVNNVTSITNVVGNSIMLTGTTANGIQMTSGATLHFGAVNIADNVIKATQAGVLAPSGFANSIALSVSNNRYYGPATGLGFAKPTWSGTTGDVIQNFNPSELGSASSKYVVDHWVCLGGTTWQDQRMLTGN